MIRRTFITAPRSFLRTHNCFTRTSFYLLKEVYLNMEVVTIKSTDPDHVRLITEFAQNLGSEVSLVDEEDAEDYALGQLMIQKKTGKEVSRDVIMAKLRT